ncbi:GTPase HflX [Thermococcus gorgonarius]|uniref:GTPase HflX n=1 Tax=Thermococcus gorgonarius TaxID=71997 RepID=A0A2Z2M5W1_THEGO|nr:GTPase HflX [Thermococcus gorgonarius]ASJ01417.1 GTP-binding protein HflX [Thermococcus gorgonarius]
MRVIGVIRNSRRERLSREEFEELLESAGYEVLAILEQNREEHPRYNIGRGKLEELKRLVEDLRPDKVVFANKLTPSQAYNLWKELRVDVIDRWQLVLEIFEKRAHSKEAKLQVELASLQYEVPLVKEAIRRIKLGDRAGFKGMGEYQTQQYLKHIRYRMGKIRKELEKVRADREVKRKRREEMGFILVALVGYTNAGKSTLLNALAGEEVEARQQMFTTLATTTRRFKLGRKRALVTDTVGFIDNLPPFIVEAFHSTLEEITRADIIVLVLDASEPWAEVRRKVLASLRVLRELKAPDKPMIIALNKIDLVEEEDAEEKARLLGKLLEEVAPNVRAIVKISAKEGRLEELYRALEESIPELPKYRAFRVVIPPTEDAGKVISTIEAIGEVLDVQYGESTVVHALIQTGMIKELTKMNVRIEHLNESDKVEQLENGK